MDAFVARRAGTVTAVLECFDRVVFQGHLPINYPESMTRFLRETGVTASGYAGFVCRQSEELRWAAEQWAATEGRPCVFLKTCGRKEAWAREIAARDGVSEGLVAILRTTEMGRSFSVRGGLEHPRLVSAARRGLHLYFYLMDAHLGWIHIRLQTWFPFLIQIAVNGHDILAHQLDRAGLAYDRHDNSFTWMERPDCAQAYARRLLTWNWSRILDRLAQQANPLLRTLLRGLSYRWVIDQCELSTDLLFDAEDALRSLYPRLVQHAALCFKADDILGFLGRRPRPGLFRGEVLTEHHERDWGLRLKHRVGRNWIKMYNKGGSILRVETVINHPPDFRVLRSVRHRDGSRETGLAPLPKAVAYMRHYWDIQTRANRHYLEALAAVQDPTAALAQIDQLASPVTRDQVRIRGLNPLARPDRQLLGAVIRAEYHLQGFRNEHIRTHLHPTPVADPRARKRQSARVRRQLIVLRGHGLLRRIPRTRHYRVTALGTRLITAALYYEGEALPKRIMQSEKSNT